MAMAKGSPSKIRRRNDEKKRIGKLRANGPALHLGRVPPGDRQLPGDYGGTGQDQRGDLSASDRVGGAVRGLKRGPGFSVPSRPEDQQSATKLTKGCALDIALRPTIQRV